MTTLGAIALAACLASSRMPAPAIDRAVPDRPPRAEVVRIIRGVASFVDPAYGARYLAARLPRGTRLRVCGPVGCIRGTVNDYGPSKRIFPGRVVDLSAARFRLVCGSTRLGVCRVRVEILGA